MTKMFSLGNSQRIIKNLVHTRNRYKTKKNYRFLFGFVQPAEGLLE